MKMSLKYAVATGAFVATQLLVTAPAWALGSPVVPGNNGTLKVHQAGTPSGTENNDPKVCAFNLEGFGLDAGQIGYLQFETQGSDAPHGSVASTKYVIAAANSDGYAASQY